MGNKTREECAKAKLRKYMYVEDTKNVKGLV
jgi:hypothetical protein